MFSKVSVIYLGFRRKRKLSAFSMYRMVTEMQVLLKPDQMGLATQEGQLPTSALWKMNYLHLKTKKNNPSRQLQRKNYVAFSRQLKLTRKLDSFQVTKL